MGQSLDKEPRVKPQQKKSQPRKPQPTEEKKIEQDPKKVRIFVNGCFDLLHPGHYNAFRQAKYLVDPPAHIVVGVHFSSEVRRVKNKETILTDAEKVELMKSCKFIDEVAEDIPYDAITADIIDKYDCQYAAHGDDLIPLPDGSTMYQSLESVGRFKMFKRTEGVSTTDLINRLVEMSKPDDVTTVDELPSSPRSAWTRFACSTSRISDFLMGNKPQQPGSKVVYIDGDFDFLHPGHIRALKKAREFGDFLIVGVHSDQFVRSYKNHNLQRGDGFPILREGERAIAVLSCRHVDDVLFDAPEKLSNEFLHAMNIDIVVEVLNNSDFVHADLSAAADGGKLVQCDMSSNTFTTLTIVDRVLNLKSKGVSTSDTK